jgi:hypothetical protein
MRTACLARPIFLDFIILILLGGKLNEIHYAIFSSFHLFYPSSVKIFSSAPCSQTLNSVFLLFEYINCRYFLTPPPRICGTVALLGVRYGIYWPMYSYLLTCLYFCARRVYLVGSFDFIRPHTERDMFTPVKLTALNPHMNLCLVWYHWADR